MSNLLITNLDFVNSKNEYNEASLDDLEYYDYVSDSSDCIIRVHKTELAAKSKDAVALFISPFA